jgi:hypothetical protein
MSSYRHHVASPDLVWVYRLRMAVGGTGLLSNAVDDRGENTMISIFGLGRIPGFMKTGASGIFVVASLVFAHEAHAQAMQSQQAEPGATETRATETRATQTPAPADQVRESGAAEPIIGRDLLPRFLDEEEMPTVETLLDAPVMIGDERIGTVQEVARSEAGEIGFVVRLAEHLTDRPVFVPATRMIARRDGLVPGFTLRQLQALPEITEPLREAMTELDGDARIPLRRSRITFD